MSEYEINWLELAQYGKSGLLQQTMIRSMLSKVEDETAPTDDPVKADVDKVLDHILHRRAVKHHSKLKRTIEQVERTKSSHDEAVGRAITE